MQGSNSPLVPMQTTLFCALRALSAINSNDKKDYQVYRFH